MASLGLTMRRQARWCAMATSAWLAISAAHAGLFDDDEARRAILDVRQRVEANRLAAEAAQQRLAEELRQRIPEETAPLRRSLLDLQNQIEALRSDLASLRGQNEQLVRLVSEMQQRQKDVTADVEERLRRFEPVKVSVDGLEFAAEPAEKRAYEAALVLFRQGNFAAAIAAFGAFNTRYPGSGYLGSSQFWLGNAQYAARDYKEAMASFRALLTRDPVHQRVPEALLAIANCQLELKDPRGARKTLEDLLRDHPKSEAAAAARERLTRLR